MIHGVEVPMFCSGDDCRCTRTFRASADDGLYYCIHCGRMKYPAMKRDWKEEGKIEAQRQTDWQEDDE